MNKEQNIIRFYLLANKLKELLRTGWVEIGIQKERTESVAEHVYGTLILAITINSEYKYDLDMEKVLIMLTLHELEEIIISDHTIRSSITPEEKIEEGKVAVAKITKGLMNQSQIEKLLNEFNEHKTKEAIFCYHVDKLECDFQAKVYDLQGVMLYDMTREDLAFYGDRALEIDGNSKTASDFWIEYDRPKYADDKIFEDLLNTMQKTTKLPM